MVCEYSVLMRCERVLRNAPVRRRTNRCRVQEVYSDRRQTTVGKCKRLLPLEKLRGVEDTSYCITVHFQSLSILEIYVSSLAESTQNQVEMDAVEGIDKPIKPPTKTRKRFVGSSKASSSSSSGRTPIRRVANQIPDDILNDPQLNEAIAGQCHYDTSLAPADRRC